MCARQGDADGWVTSADAEAVSCLRGSPNETMHRLDSFRYEGRMQRWVSVGSDAGCDIVVADAEAFHCLLLREDGRLFVRDDRHDGRTLVNGLPVLGGLVELGVGNLLTVAGTTLLACGTAGATQRIRIDPVVQQRRLLDLWQPAADDTASNEASTRTATVDRRREGDNVYYLRLVGTDELIGLHALVHAHQPERPIVLGKQDSCAIYVDDNNASGEHCSLQYRQRRWYVLDHGSKNGSFLDGVRLPAHAPVELCAGSLLTVGKQQFLACGASGLGQVARSAPPVVEYGRRAVDIHGTPSRAARRLGMPRQTLQGWLKRRKGAK